eukprot:gene4621-5772_t
MNNFKELIEYSSIIQEFQRLDLNPEKGSPAEIIFHSYVISAAILMCDKLSNDASDTDFFDTYKDVRRDAILDAIQNERMSEEIPKIFIDKLRGVEQGVPKFFGILGGHIHYSIVRAFLNLMYSPEVIKSTPKIPDDYRLRILESIMKFSQLSKNIKLQLDYDDPGPSIYVRGYSFSYAAARFDLVQEFQLLYHPDSDQMFYKVLDIACENDSIGVVEYILRQYPNYLVDFPICLPLYNAVSHRSEKVLKLILEFQPALPLSNTTTEDGSVGEYCIQNKLYSYVKTMTDSHFSLKSVVTSRNSLLTMAVRSKDPKMVELILENIRKCDDSPNKDLSIPESELLSLLSDTDTASHTILTYLYGMGEIILDNHAVPDIYFIMSPVTMGFYLSVVKIITDPLLIDEWMDRVSMSCKYVSNPINQHMHRTIESYQSNGKAKKQLNLLEFHYILKNEPMIKYLLNTYAPSFANRDIYTLDPFHVFEKIATNFNQKNNVQPKDPSSYRRIEMELLMDEQKSKKKKKDTKKKKTKKSGGSSNSNGKGSKSSPQQQSPTANGSSGDGSTKNLESIDHDDSDEDSDQSEEDEEEEIPPPPSNLTISSNKKENNNCNTHNNNNNNKSSNNNTKKPSPQNAKPNTPAKPTPVASKNEPKTSKITVNTTPAKPSPSTSPITVAPSKPAPSPAKKNAPSPSKPSPSKPAPVTKTVEPPLKVSTAPLSSPTKPLLSTLISSSQQNTSPTTTTMTSPTTPTTTSTTTTPKPTKDELATFNIKLSDLDVEIGKFKFSRKESFILGRGSNGTLVYKGVWSERVPVAIKQMQKAFNPFIAKEIEVLIKLTTHVCPNIVRYVDKEEDDMFVYLGLTLCEGSLQSIIETGVSGNDQINRNKILKYFHDMAIGVQYLHSFDIVHNDLNPRNILVKDDKLLISDMGLSKMEVETSYSFTMHTPTGQEGFHPIEVLLQKRKTKSVDIFSLGCLFYFLYTGGAHPFGRERLLRVSNIINHKVDVDALKSEEHFVIHDLITWMIQQQESDRPNIKQVLGHPVFWNNHKCIKFIDSTINLFKDKKNTNHKFKSINFYDNANTKPYLQSSWNKKFDSNLLENIIQNKIDGGNYYYNYDSVKDLVRCIRNTIQHHQDIQRDTDISIFSTQESVMEYFNSRFPDLIPFLYQKFRNSEFKSSVHLSEFYNPN